MIGGRAGGFPGWVNECFTGGRQSRGIERAKIIYEIAPDLGHWGVEIVGKVKAWAKAISGPTIPPGKYPQLINAPGSETGPGPQLVTWGKSTILSVDAHGFKIRVHAEFGQAHPVRLEPAPDRPVVLASEPRRRLDQKRARHIRQSKAMTATETTALEAVLRRDRAVVGELVEHVGEATGQRRSSSIALPRQFALVSALGVEC